MFFKALVCISGGIDEKSAHKGAIDLSDILVLLKFVF